MWARAIHQTTYRNKTEAAEQCVQLDYLPGNEVVVLIEHLEEEKTIVTTFRNYAEVKKAWMEDYTVARVTTGINTEKTDILISVGNFGFA